MSTLLPYWVILYAEQYECDTIFYGPMITEYFGMENKFIFTNENVSAIEMVKGINIIGELNNFTACQQNSK